MPKWQDLGCIPWNTQFRYWPPESYFPEVSDCHIVAGLENRKIENLTPKFCVPQLYRDIE